MVTQESGVSGGWGATPSRSSSGSAPSTTSPSGGTYTDAQGKPISAEQAAASGRVDQPGVSQFQRIQGLSGSSATSGPTPQQIQPSQIQPGQAIGAAPQLGQPGFIGPVKPTSFEFYPAGLGSIAEQTAKAQSQQYPAIAKEDRPREGVAKIFHGGSSLGKFTEAIQDPSLALEYLQYDYGKLMGQKPTDKGILQARESFLNTVQSRQESYGTAGAAAIGVVESIPAQAALGGAVFKGGTLLARTGLRAATGATGSELLAKGLLFGEKSIEPLAMAGAGVAAALETKGAYEKGGIPAAAAQLTIMGGSLPFAAAGWKSTGDIYSKLQTAGRTEISAPISSEVLSGSKQFPTTAAGAKPGEVLSAFQTETGLRGYHATAESQGKEIIIANAPARPSDIGGLYVSPHGYGASPYFLRVSTGYGGGIKEAITGLGKSEPLKPTVMDIKLSSVGRLPSQIRGNVPAVREFLGTEAAQPGKAYLTPKLETTIKGGGAAEAEAVITPGTKLSQVEGTNYFKYQGRNIPINEYMAGEGIGQLKTTSPVKPMAETGGYGYQRTYVPAPAVNIGTFNLGGGIARAEPDYTTPYNVAKNLATINTDITSVTKPHSPAKVETVRNKKGAEELADTIVNDLRVQGIETQYNRRTGFIETAPPRTGLPNDITPLLSIDFFNKQKELSTTEIKFNKDFGSENLMGSPKNAQSWNYYGSRGQSSSLSGGDAGTYTPQNPYYDVPGTFPGSEGYDQIGRRPVRATERRATVTRRQGLYDLRIGEPRDIPREQPRGASYTLPREISRTQSIGGAYAFGNIKLSKPKKSEEQKKPIKAKITAKGKYFRTERSSPIMEASTGMTQSGYNKWTANIWGITHGTKKNRGQ
jgi:hypothetical protein